MSLLPDLWSIPGHSSFHAVEQAFPAASHVSHKFFVSLHNELVRTTMWTFLHSAQPLHLCQAHFSTVGSFSYRLSEQNCSHTLSLATGFKAASLLEFDSNMSEWLLHASQPLQF